MSGHGCVQIKLYLWMWKFDFHFVKYYFSFDFFPQTRQKYKISSYLMGFIEISSHRPGLPTDRHLLTRDQNSL